MKPKTIITVILLLFVAASIVYLVVKETGEKPAQSAVPPSTSSPVTSEKAEVSAITENEKVSISAEKADISTLSQDKAEEVSEVIIYYFHGNARCRTCRTIESYAEMAVRAEFADELKDGRLEWRVVNVEDQGNDYFIKDFQLSTRSVVLERITDGKRQEWKNLQRVWELVRGDKEDFLKYIQDETRSYLKEARK